jgi:hypothetical protein
VGVRWARRGAGMWRLGQIAGPPALVAVAAALLLRLAAAVPSVLQPCPGKGAGRWETLRQAEAELGVPVWVPARVPPGVAWPPRRIECVTEAPLTVRVAMDLREAPGGGLELTQALGAAPPAPGRAARAGPTEASPVAVNGGGVLRVERGPDGRTWRQVEWVRDGRHLILRAPLPTEELLRAARSVGPPAPSREVP